MTAPQTDLNHLVARLIRLERQNRRWKFGTLGLVIAVGIALLMGSQDKDKEKPKEVKDTSISTERFGLRDAQGKDRLRMSMGMEGPVMTFLDDSGAEQASITAGRQGMVLRFVDSRGQLITGISLERAGVALVNIDNNGRLQSGPNAVSADAGMLRPGRR